MRNASLSCAGASRGARRHVVLNSERAAHRLHHAGEFGEEAIAHALEDAPLVLRRSGSQNLLVHGPEISQGSFLVLSHQPRIAGEVGGHDCGEPPFDVRVAPAVCRHQF